jgi:hypothetical protein
MEDQLPPAGRSVDILLNTLESDASFMGLGDGLAEVFKGAA